MAQRVSMKDAMEETEPPKPPRGELKLVRSVKSASRTQKKAKVIQLGKRREPTTDVERELRDMFENNSALRVAVGLEEPPEYVEVPEQDPASPAVAEGASPADDDDALRYQAWLEHRTPIGATTPVQTRSESRRTDEDYVELEDGERCLAPQRLRRVCRKVKVQTPKGPRRHKVYEQMPAPVEYQDEIVEINTGGLEGRTYMAKQKRYSASNRSPLRNPWNAAGKHTWLGAEYFKSPKYATGVQKSSTYRTEESQESRTDLGKTKLNSIPPVLERVTPTYSVYELCRKPNLETTPGRVCPEAANQNFEMECLSHDVLTELETASVDTDSLMQESVLYHREDGTLLVQAPAVQAGLRDIIVWLEESANYVGSNVKPHVDNESQGSSEYEWFDVNQAANDPVIESVAEDYGELLEPARSGPPESGFVPYPEGFLQPESEQAPPLRSMSGWSKDFSLHHIKSDDVRPWVREPTGAEKSNQSESIANITFVNSEGTALKTDLPNTDANRNQVAYAASQLKPRSIPMPEVDSIVHVKDNVLALTVHGRTRLVNVETEQGLGIINELVDTLTHTLDELLGFETQGRISLGMQPTEMDSIIYEYPESEPVASMRKMVYRDIFPAPRFAGFNNTLERMKDRPELGSHTPEMYQNYRQMNRKAERLAHDSLERAKLNSMYTELFRRGEWDLWLLESIKMWKQREFSKRKARAEFARMSARAKAREYLRIHQQNVWEQERLERQSSIDRYLLNETAWYKRMAHRHRKERRIAKRDWIIRSMKKEAGEMMYRTKSWIQDTLRLPKSKDIAANPPIVGEAPKGVVQAEKARPVTRVPYVDPLRNEQDPKIELITEITEDDVQLLNICKHRLRKDLPARYLEAETEKIYKPSFGQAAQRRREKRTELATRLVA